MNAYPVVLSDASSRRAGPSTKEPLMPARAALPDGFHFSIAISQSLWADLLSEALPIEVGKGDWDLMQSGQKLIEAAETQVKGLLTGVEDRLDASTVLGGPRARGARSRVRGLARRGRKGITRRLRRSVHVGGTWRSSIAKEGSGFRYHDGGVTLDARASFELEGRALLLGEQIEIPFRITRDVDGTVSLDEVHFERSRRQLEGELGNVSLSVGEGIAARLLKIVGDRLIDRQIQKLNPLPLIPGETLENMITPGEGPLKFAAGIEDLHVGITDQDLVLSVRFGFRGR